MNTLLWLRFVRGLGVLVTVAAMGATVLDAQQGGSITGQTRTADTGRPLAAVQVSIPDLNIGALSQANGRFLIQNVPVGTHSLTVTRIGSRSVIVQVVVGAGQTVALDFDMETEALALDEIVVTGTAGGTQRRAIGNVVGRVDAAALVELSAVTDVRDLIGTRIPGVAVMGGSGAVGAGTTIRIRGASSLSLTNAPIVYIDGVRIESGARPDGGFGQESGSRLDDFSPEDIESIEIIKGPAAATLYGTEAANGVIQIITKRGQEGEVVFDMSVRRGINWMPNPRRYFGNKWFRTPAGELVNEWIYDKEEARLGYPFVQNGSTQYLHLGARGGSERLRFAASLDTDRENGVFADHPNTDNRDSGRLNVDFLAGETLDVRMSLNYVQRSHVNPEPCAGCGPVGNMFFGTHEGLQPATRGYYRFVPEDVENIFLVEEAGRFTGSMTMSHTPTSWLAQRLTFGVDDTGETHRELYPRHPLGADFSGPRGGLGELRERAYDYKNYTVDYSATATAAVPWVSNVESQTAVGFQYYDRQITETRATGYVFPAPPLTTMGATSGGQEATGTWEENVTVGVYFQEQLAFGDNFFVTGAVRADDNSAFGAEYDIAIYPKVSATWSIDEPFEFTPWLDLVRLRGAFGAAGQQPSAFAGVRLYDPIPGPGGTAAITPGEVGNPTLKPERSEELEVGFDAGLFGGRTGLEVTYYNRVTKDAIVRRQLAPSVGFPGQQYVNAGQVDNWGFEVGINHQVIRPGGPLSWSLGMAFATMNNKLVRLGLPGTTELSAGGRGVRHVEGFPLGSAFEWEIVSAAFDTDFDVINATCMGPASIGAVRREQASVVPVSEGCAYIYQDGPLDPTWDLSISSDMTIFQNLRLSVTVQGRGGHTGFSRNLGPTVQCCPWARPIWSQDQPLIVAIGDLRRQGVGHFDAGHVRLQDVSLWYDVPAGMAARIGAARVTLGVQAMNVAFLWRESEYSRIVERAGLEGDDRESFFVAEPNIRSQGNFNTSNYVQQPTKALLTSVRLTF